MKKFYALFALLLVFSFVMTLTACERTLDPDPTQPNGSQTEDDDEEPESLITPEGVKCRIACIGGDHSRCTLAPREEVPFEGYEPTDHQMRDIPSSELIKEIKTGWNLGNTFDAPNETAWHNPKTTYTMFYAVKEAGFDSIRLPVSWGGHTGDAPDYKIDEELMDRIEEVVQYILALDMYCILNTHHEMWLFPTDEREEQNTEQLTAMWKQICERFADYNEKLIFESMNEPRLFGTENEWNGGTAEARQVVSRLNAAFIEVVRGSGGNNAIRHLMIPSYAASSDYAAMKELSDSFPENDDKVIASIHAYVAYKFALAEKGHEVFNPEKVHGPEIDRMFGHLQELFLDKDIPVILGETGARIRNDNTEARVEWAKYYFGKGRELAIPVYWWDNGLFVGRKQDELFGLLNRHQSFFAFPEIVAAIMGE